MPTWYRLGDYVICEGVFVYDAIFNIWYTWLEFCHMLDEVTE